MERGNKAEQDFTKPCSLELELAYTNMIKPIWKTGSDRELL